MKSTASIFTATALLFASLGTAAAQPPVQRPNVLLICVDDLRCEAGSYGVKGIQTPNIDRLAREGRLFSRQYVTAASCGPSRCTMLTSRRTLEWDVWKEARNGSEEPRGPVALPHLFRKNGYTTVCIGKVSHEPGGVMDEAQTIHEIPFAWDRAYTEVGAWGTPWHAFFAYDKGAYYNRVLPQANDSKPRLPYEKTSDDTELPDTLNASAAIKDLHKLSAADKPFFLAIGIYKPHLPFVSPARNWDMYDPEEIPMASNTEPASDTDPAISLHKSYEPTTHYLWPEGSGNVSPESARTLKQAYWAAASFADEQIGRVLDAYRELGLVKNTIVVLWSDHGWHLGEHGIWGKATLHEVSLRSPFIVRVPNQPFPGVPANGLVESVDIYPTLAGLCGLDAPANLQGRSQAALVRDPKASGKPFAVGYYKNGRTIRTDTHRYTEWKDKSGQILQRELYDHRSDAAEAHNIAAAHPDLVRDLSLKMNASIDTLK